MTAIVAVPVAAPVPISGGRGRRLLAGFAAVALLLVVVQGWMPRLADPEQPLAEAPAHPAEQASFDTADVIERATHALAPVPGRSGALEVRAEDYRAEFGASGFTYTPTEASAGLEVSLSTIERGGDALALDRGGWRADGNLAHRELSTTIDEQVTARRGEIEWDVVLGSAPAGTGDLAVTADLNGVVGEPTLDRSAESPAWLLELAGSTVRLGEIVVLDGGGRQLHRALPAIDGDTVELRVPHVVLADATYPVTIDPTVSGAVPIEGAGAVTEASNASIAFDGSNYLVAWHRYVADTQRYDIYAARVTGDGQSVGGALHLSLQGDNNHQLPDVAWNGSKFLVVWQYAHSPTDHDIYGQFVTSSGFRQGTTIFVSSPSSEQLDPAVTTAGSNFYVVWEDTRNGNTNIFGGRILNAGGALDGSGIAITSDARREYRPDVAWNGGAFLVVYQLAFGGTDEDVKGRLVNRSAVPVGPVQTISGSGVVEEHPAVASDGEDYLVVWGDARSNRADIRGARINSLGGTINAFPISNRANYESFPAVAFDGIFLVAWREYVDNDIAHSTRASRVTRSGGVSDPNPLILRSQNGGNPSGVSVSPGPANERWGVVQGDYDDGIDFRTVSSK